MTVLGRTGLDIHELQLGANTFGGTADRAESLRILDRYREAGGNSVDTADVYSRWLLGNTGGESERVIGEWLAAHGNRAEIVVATKVGSLDPYRTLDAPSIRAALENSLARLRTDYVDIYYLHRDDPGTDLAETLGALGELVEEGLVRHLGASNFSAERLAEALRLQRASGLPEFEVVQELYNVLQRDAYETATLPVAREFDLVNLPYRSLASGLLTARHRPDAIAPTAHAPRIADQFATYGTRVLDTVVDVAARRGVAPAAVALAWLRTRPTVAVPLAGARSVAQLEDLLQSFGLHLDEAETARLDAAGAAPPAVREVA